MALINEVRLEKCNDLAVEVVYQRHLIKNLSDIHKLPTEAIPNFLKWLEKWIYYCREIPPNENIYGTESFIYLTKGEKNVESFKKIF